jgi:hypothetical protein
MAIVNTLIYGALLPLEPARAGIPCPDAISHHNPTTTTVAALFACSWGLGAFEVAME